MRQLTKDEVNSLPVGTHVFVTWSGGNGPFWYRITEDKWNRKMISTLDGTYVESVDRSFVGKYPLTTVFIEES